jgi:F-type H+-transporting ATPase subunit delta
MSDSAIADRYALAIFEIGVETGQLEAISGQIRKAAAAYTASPELRAVLENPLVGEDARESLLKELAGRLSMSEAATNALRLIARRRRLSVLAEIAQRLGTLSDEKAGIVRATVVTAVPLPEDIYSQLQSKIESHTKKRVVLERKQDPTLIGGIVTKIGDNTIDGSIKGRLEELTRQLLA